MQKCSKYKHSVEDLSQKNRRDAHINVKARNVIFWMFIIVYWIILSITFPYKMMVTT